MDVCARIFDTSDGEEALIQEVTDRGCGGRAHLCGQNGVDRESIAQGSPERLTESRTCGSNFDTLWTWLNETVGACEAETWEASVDRLRRWFDWEYDYSPPAAE